MLGSESSSCCLLEQATGKPTSRVSYGALFFVFFFFAAIVVDADGVGGPNLMPLPLLHMHTVGLSTQS